MLVLLLLFAGAAPPQTESPLIQRARELIPVVEETRGLRMPEPVGIGAYSRYELREFLLREAEREIVRAWYEDGAKALKALGLLPRDLDLWQTELEMLTNNIAGFYHQRSKELKLIREEGESEMTDEEEIYMVHELTHAAQDQNFDLKTFGDIPDNDDIDHALTALTEGDATLTMLRWRFGDEAVERARMIAGMMRMQPMPYPRYLVRTLTFPYSEGLIFAAAAYRHFGGDLAAFDRMYSDPPVSTEQILHPEKYLSDRDHPVYIELGDHRDALPQGPDAWRRLKADTTLGELGIAIWLREHGVRSDMRAGQMARGWDGDRFAIYERASDGAWTSVWFTTWDDEEAAARFFDAARAALRHKYGRAREESEFETDDGLVRIERRNLDVLILEGVRGDSGRLAEAAWRRVFRAELVRIMRTPPRFRCPAHPDEDDFERRPCPQCGLEMEPIPDEGRIVHDGES